jgi:putative ABC transport system permease protein
MASFILRYIFRSFRRNLLYHAINITGLVIALTSVFYILIWINLETSYDNFHPGVDRLYRFTAVSYVNRQWDEMYPDFPFRYELVDELYEGIYRREILQARILGVISILTMIITCLGLVGLMHHLAGTRIREIGIRKVNGAGIGSILILLNRDFLVMVLITILIGIPVSWHLVGSWLENFIYRIEIKWWIMLLTGAGFLVVSLLTVTFQSWEAALRNPVSSLRYE